MYSLGYTIQPVKLRVKSCFEPLLCKVAATGARGLGVRDQGFCKDGSILDVRLAGFKIFRSRVGL